MLKVLIVDDTKSIHAFIKAVLAKVEGVQFTDVYNGLEAITLLKQKPNSFDVILLDWEMPVMTGPETVTELTKMGNTIPVIMTTTKNAASDIEQMLNAGVAEYMMKPFTLDIIVEKIESVCGKTLLNAA